MIYYKTTLYTYNEFLKENNTDRLSKNEKIKSPGAGLSKYISNIEKIDEIFDSKLDKLDFKEEVYDHPVYEGEKNTTYFFKSKRGNEYRLDLVILMESNSNLKDNRLHNKKFISVSFSISDATDDNYDDVTNKNELYDVMSRIRYLIKLNEYRINNGYVFMFGKPDEEKINMYSMFIKICFPDYKLIVDYTSGFPNTNVGYYFVK